MMKVKHIEHQQGTFLGAAAGKLYYQSWHPNSKTRAVVAIVHGLGGHSDLFDNLVEFLSDRAIAVYSFDLRGHGRSEGQRGYINSWSEFREDLRAFLQLVATQEPNLPLFLLGQSLGGAIALDYALHYPNRLEGLILLSPALSVRISPLKLLLGRIFSQFIPRFSLNTGIDLTAGSRDPQVVAAAVRDTLRHTKGTARLATEFFQTVSWIQANAAKLQVPLLIFHGGGDRITPPEGSRWLFENVALADKEYHEYPEGYHELHKDLDYQEVFADIGNWISKKVRS